MCMKENANNRKIFDQDWRFLLETEPYIEFPLVAGKCGEVQGYAADVFNDTGWERVNLPHDWAFGLPMENEWGITHGHYKVPSFDGYNSDPFTRSKEKGFSVGWYRKTFYMEEKDADKLVYLTFDGVFRDCMLWINGAYLGRNMSGYIGFTYEISDMLRFDGPNTIAVRVDASEKEGWWYEGAGIYRHVYLECCERVLVEKGSLFVHSEIDGSVCVTGQVYNATEDDVEVTVRLEITGEACVTPVELSMTVPSFDKASMEAGFQIDNPILWDIDNPHLYELKVILSCKSGPEYEKSGCVTDVVTQTFGIRSIKFDAENGFFLNGRRVQINGACVHQDFACVGVAVPDDVHEYKIRKLKEMGVNAYRSSHNAPAPELVEACDRLGMLLMDETRMFGSSPEILGQMEALVRRDRNHPSVILWSLGNEEHSVQSNDRGRRMAKTMIRAIHALDDTRPITFGGNNGIDYEGINECVDVRGFNYLHIRKQDYLEKYHELHPEQPLVGTEEASCIYTRGETVTDFEKKLITCYDEYVMSWGSTAEGWLKYLNNHPYISGAFLWTGFDYSGEPIPYPENSVTNFGIMDLCGYPKDSYYYYKSWWTSEDVLYLFPDWNRQPGEVVRVVVYSNAEEVELFVNGRSLGRQNVPYLGHLEWKVPFESGCIEAVAWRDGAEIKRHARYTTGAPQRIRLRVENRPFTGTTALVTAEIVDAEGNMVPYAGNEVFFGCKNGKILGVGNGDPGSYEPNQFSPVKVTKVIEEWKTADGENYDVCTPASSTLWEYVFRDVVTDVPVEPPFCDQKRLVLMTPKLEQELLELHTTFEDEGGTALLEFARVEAEFCEIILNGESLTQFKKNPYPQAFEVCTQKGKNHLIVKLYAPEGFAALREGVTITRLAEPIWKRKAFHGLCMAMIEMGENALVWAESNGLEGDEIIL